MNADDPRVGSARDGSQAPNTTRLGAGINSPSLATLVATLIPVLAYTIVCLLIFLTLRTRCPRVYSPRTTLKSLEPHERSAPLSRGIFKWFKQFRQVPDSFVLNHGSIDGFLFLRFLKILILIFAVGSGIALPVLLPINAIGKGGNDGLDLFTMGNVTDKTYYYAHAAVACVFFSFVLYIVTREAIYCIHLRHVCLTSPFYAERLSARTMLVTSIPHEYLHESKIRATFGSTVRNVWIPRATESLEDLVRERGQTAARLEKAEWRLIRIANTARSKALGVETNNRLIRRKTEKQMEPASLYVSGKDEESPPASVAPLPDVNGSVASQWISHSSRPVHRPLANAARRVDSIKWTRNRLKALAKRILKERLELLQSPDKAVLPAAFIEFASQADAQIASQTLSYHQPLYMAERYAGVRPYEIVWSSLSFSQLGRMSRKFAMQAFVAVLVIFWALPCALVGMISNIVSLSYKIPFLSWVRDLPGPVLSILTGLIPALALAWIMSIVPWILRLAARVAGTPTLTMVEVYTQKSYIIFQIVQVFLVTTLTSAVSAALTQILENPMSATTLLSQNLPKSSNFYISYILVQALVLGSASLVSFFDLLRYCIFTRLPHDRRKSYERFHRLREVHLGAVFPVFTNLGIIGICYACIAPLILAFATFGIGFVYMVYRYNALYVYDTEVDTRGLLYPAALMQLIWGLYLAEVCLIGLFSLKGAAGPIGMTVALLVITFLIHRALSESLGPLLFDLPKSLAGSGTSTSAMMPIDPFSQAIAEHNHNQTHDYLAGHSTSSQHPLFADIAEEDGPVHVPGAARHGSSAEHSHTDSSTNTYRYTITALPQIKPGLSLSEELRSHEEGSSAPHFLEESIDEDEKAPQETTRGASAATDAAPFQLEGFIPLFKTFYMGGSKILSGKLLPYRTQLTNTLTPVTSHSRYISFITTLRSLSPLYYASAKSPIPNLIAQLRDLDVPQYPKDLRQIMYLHPSMYAPPPRLWIPKDKGGVSKQECEHNNCLGKGVVECTDDGWDIDEKGKMKRDLHDSTAEWCADRGSRGRW